MTAPDVQFILMPTLWNFQDARTSAERVWNLPWALSSPQEFSVRTFYLQSTEKFYWIPGCPGCRVSVTYALPRALYWNIILLGSHRFRVWQTDLEALYYNPGFSDQIVLPGYMVMGAWLSYDVGRDGAGLLLFLPTQHHRALSNQGSHTHLSGNLFKQAIRLHLDWWEIAVMIIQLLKSDFSEFLPHPGKTPEWHRGVDPLGASLIFVGCGSSLCLRVGIGQVPLDEMKAGPRGGERHPSSPWQSDLASFAIVFHVYVFYCFGWLSAFSRWGVTPCSSPPVSVGGRGTEGQWSPSALHMSPQLCHHTRSWPSPSPPLFFLACLFFLCLFSSPDLAKCLDPPCHHSSEV